MLSTQLAPFGAWSQLLASFTRTAPSPHCFSRKRLIHSCAPAAPPAPGTPNLPPPLPPPLLLLPPALLLLRPVLLLALAAGAVSAPAFGAGFGLPAAGELSTALSSTNSPCKQAHTALPLHTCVRTST
jgi:hypothetical protein